MEKLQTMPSPSTTLHGRPLPPLEAGDHLDQATFHARYEASARRNLIAAIDRLR